MASPINVGQIETFAISVSNAGPATAILTGGIQGQGGDPLLPYIFQFFVEAAGCTNFTLIDSGQRPEALGAIGVESVIWTVTVTWMPCWPVRF